MRMKLKTLIIIGVVVLSMVMNSAQSSDNGNAYYVSRNGTNADGLSWETAWSELDQINWDVIQAGDTINIDGGQTQMTYETSLAIGQSGEADNPIVIQASTEGYHDGQVVFFGGRETLLPYCGQKDYDNSAEETYSAYGVRTHDHDYVVIDGSRWHGIQIEGYQTNGIRIDANSSHVTVRNVEVFNNGSAVEHDDGWRSDFAGVRIGGTDITFQRVVIHDNGQDAIQSLSEDNNLENFRLEQSWLYNEREHPDVDESANYCTHSDGIQIFDGGTISGLTVTESVIGPGFTQNVMLGQSPNGNGSQASVQDVVFRDVLFTKAADNNVVGYRDTDSHNWLLERVTIHCPNTKAHCVRIPNSDHTVVDSIVANGKITFPDGLNTYEGNCIWDTTGFELGENVNPSFANVSNDNFSLDDYSVAPDSGCVGSRVTSVEALYDLGPQENPDGD